MNSNDSNVTGKFCSTEPISCFFLQNYAVVCVCVCVYPSNDFHFPSLSVKMRLYTADAQTSNGVFFSILLIPYHDGVHETCQCSTAFLMSLYGL